ncbi:hypothetical protein DSL72_000260 [Monilinia vaccinii-corymbosi]|uniref:DUF7580 domain-containing protein n=1 Tax=Monilinia vaccinii-corymbosi TaxID=61207 RepID=A0A8A3P159_9HELO|nr:hypothetical protein DSL72_000260 [Monilinia vaccinii-corymbosi]
MSAIEVTGLVLAILPLFIEGAKAYSHGVETIRKTVSRRERDEKLMEFYDEFYWEIVQLDRQTLGVIKSLPNLSDKRKAELTIDINSEAWEAEVDVAQALFDYFGSKEDLDAFLHVMGKIAQLLSQLIKDPTIHILSTDVEQSKMFRKLKSFAADREKGESMSTFKERIRFWKKEKERTICLKNLATWNKRLFKLAEQAQKEPPTNRSSLGAKHVPSSQLRSLSHKLYRALAKCWGCNCATRHQAKFCLKARGDSARSTVTEIDFDFLFSVQEDLKLGRWQEGRVVVRSNGNSTRDDRSLLQRICDTVGCGGPIDQCLQLLVEDSGKDQMLWQLRSIPKRLPKSRVAEAESLQAVLAKSMKLPLVTKRRLAVVFAHSLLQLHEIYWENKEWNKNHIFFFYDISGDLDFQRPYLSTVPDLAIDEKQTPLNLNRFHRNPSILALGLLLIEIDTGRLIETFRTEVEKQEVNTNTDWLVANRVVKTLADCSLGYRDAIQSCLDTPWVPAGQRVNLEDVGTRAGVYQDIIKPLEDELTYLFREQI